MKVEVPRIGTQQTKHPITSFRLIITTVTNPFVLQNHNNTSTSIAERISRSTPSTTNIVAAVMTTVDQAALHPQQQVVLPQTVVLAPNAATTDTTLEDRQVKPMWPITSPQIPDSGPSAATPTSSLQTTTTTPTLPIPQQIDHTFTNPTATTSTAAMTSVTAQAPGMAVNLTVCSPATIAALLPQLTGSLHCLRATRTANVTTRPHSAPG
uniref:Uncharacterized protein n=1 Tax=Glossina pallidipes TaxID=7398 RepID=A0A1B0ACQ5_GLOPL